MSPRILALVRRTDISRRYYQTHQNMRCVLYSAVQMFMSNSCSKQECFDQELPAKSGRQPCAKLGRLCVGRGFMMVNADFLRSGHDMAMN